MYNEPFTQLIESLAGIYRTYYELIHWDESYRNRVHVVIVADGYDKLSKSFLSKLEDVGMYNAFNTAKYKNLELSSDKSDINVVFKGKIFHSDQHSRTQLH